MCQEHRCEFVLVAQGLAPAEVGSGPWIGPMLPRCIEGVAPFCPHLLLLLVGGDFGGWRVGSWGGVVGCVGGGGGGGGGGGVGGGGGGGGGGLGCWVGWGGGEAGNDRGLGAWEELRKGFW